MKLIAPLVRRNRPTEVRYTTEDYANWLAQSWGWGSFGFQGSQYPLSGVQMTQPGSKTEPIGENFQGYINHGLKANGVVWTCEAVRIEVFAQAEFKFQQLDNGKPGQLFGTRALEPLERSGLLAQAILDADMAGNFYGLRIEDEIIRLRPDWVDIVLEAIVFTGRKVGFRRVGYFYFDGGRRDAEPAVLLPDEVAHFSLKPDPLATFRGMSWLTPLVREVMGDTAYTRHKNAFMDNAATPNLAVAFPKEVTVEQFKQFVSEMNAAHTGHQNAGKTLYTAGGADVTVVGANMHQLDFKVVQGAGESRIAAASGVGAVIAQFSEGMQGSSLNAGNYQASRRRFSDIPMQFAWKQAAKGFSTVIAVPAGSRLWPSLDDVSFLQEDAKDAAEISQLNAQTIGQYVRDGFTPESAKAAVITGDESLLVHSGLVSVQLQPPGLIDPASQPAMAGLSSNGGQ